METNHTQEWSGTPCPYDPDNYWIDDNTGERVAAAGGRRMSASDVARACNAHDDLVAALESIADAEPMDTDAFICDFDTLQGIARAALAKAKAGAK